MPITAQVRAARAALLDQLRYAMDATAWREVVRRDGVQVAVGRPAYGAGEAPHRVEGFHIQAEVSGTSVAHGLAYFHDACHFADSANKMTSASEIIEVLCPERDTYEAVVRTGFRLPWPLQDREFLHYVTASRAPDGAGRDTALVAYATVDDPRMPPPWPGALRCRMRPSGQRITALGGGRVRFEHCMTYDLGGWIPAGVQNLFFHRGHAQAYAEEWVAAMAVVRRESEAPARALGRVASRTS